MGRRQERKEEEEEEEIIFSEHDKTIVRQDFIGILTENVVNRDDALFFTHLATFHRCFA